MQISKICYCKITLAIFMKITYVLLIEMHKSINNLSPPIMKDFFDLKNTWYDLRSKQFLKLPETILDMVHKLSVLKVA